MVLNLIGVNPSAPFSPILNNMPVNCTLMHKHKAILIHINKKETHLILLDLGAGHVQLKTANPQTKCTRNPGTLGDLGGYILQNIRAPTFRKLAPDRELHGWDHVNFIFI